MVNSVTDGQTIRDLLYLDFDKAASIWSQFEEGLLERVSVTEDTGKDRAAGTKFGIAGIAEANLGVDYLQKKSTLQSKTLHHDLLNRVEGRLLEAGLVTDLSEAVDLGESSATNIRAAIAERPYLRAEGNSVLEDYKRILAISEKFNEIVGVIVKATQETAKKSPAYIDLQKMIDAEDDAATAIKDRNQKAVKKAKVNEMRRKLEELLKPQLSAVDGWLIDGMRLFINTFMPSRINFRIYPFPNCPAFQVLCNLKRECFVDSDLEHLLYGYGNRPNVPLAVFGLITSIPPESPTSFNPLLEFTNDPALAEAAGFEHGFRGVFGGMEGMESLVRFSRYPNVTVHPIAVYRSFTINAA
jgi:hypothetical protein